jgi:hypothetical protein
MAVNLGRSYRCGKYAPRVVKRILMFSGAHLAGAKKDNGFNDFDYFQL